MLYASDGTTVLMSFKLEFPCSNNEAEYEALIITLFTPVDKDLYALFAGYSKLIINQVKREFTLQEIALVSYQTGI